MMKGERLCEVSCNYFQQYLSKIEYTVDLLDDTQLWWRPNNDSNSVGNLILHAIGNLSQWVLGELGGDEYERDRSFEFDTDQSATDEELVERLKTVVGRAREVIRELDEDELEAEHTVQGYETDGLGVVMHAVEHLSYHTGQIVYIGKQLKASQQKVEFYPQHADE